LTDIIVRFFIGGLVVSAFSLISDLLKPKTFAGLFGAAPSIALATLALTVMKEGKQYAAIEGRSMILGAVALFAYSLTLSYVLVRLRISALSASMVLLFLWMFVASGLWYVVLN
jgi:ABC-type multidrug transport system permease subunit